MLNDKIKQIAESSLNFGMNNRYANSVQLSGWIMQKPKFSHNPRTNSKAVSFILFQVMTTPTGEIETNSFSVITYVDGIMEQLMKLEHVAFIVLIGKLVFNRFKKTVSPQLLQCEITHETDIELEPSYERNSNETK